MSIVGDHPRDDCVRKAVAYRYPSKSVFNYRRILKEYIKHVGNCEGINYLGHSASEGVGDLSEREVDELRRLDEEIRNELD